MNNTLSKEEILGKLQKENPHSISVFKAMDEYAKQEAIEFAKWCGQNSFKYECEEDLWYYKQHPGHKYSSEIMYSQYRLSKQNKEQ